MQQERLVRRDERWIDNVALQKMIESNEGLRTVKVNYRQHYEAQHLMQIIKSIQLSEHKLDKKNCLVITALKNKAFLYCCNFFREFLK